MTISPVSFLLFLVTAPFVVSSIIPLTKMHFAAFVVHSYWFYFLFSCPPYNCRSLQRNADFRLQDQPVMFSVMVKQEKLTYQIFLPLVTVILKLLFQSEGKIRSSRELWVLLHLATFTAKVENLLYNIFVTTVARCLAVLWICLLYTSDAADE